MADDTHDEQQDQMAHEPTDGEAPDDRPDGETGAPDDEARAPDGDVSYGAESADAELGGPGSESTEDDPLGDSGEPGSGQVGNLSDFEGAASPGRRIANQLNAQIIGTLHLWYAGHDGEVVLPMDADAALRCIAGWHQNRRLRWEDTLDPVTSDGQAVWAAIELENVLCMLWLPGLPRGRQPQRMAIDPVAT